MRKPVGGIGDWAWVVGLLLTVSGCGPRAGSAEPSRHRSPPLRSGEPKEPTWGADRSDDPRDLEAPAHATPPERSRAPHTDGRWLSPRDVERLERLVHDGVNRARRDAGLGPLSWNASLGSIARGHSADMAGRHYFGHVSPDGEEFMSRFRRGGFRCEVERPDGLLSEGGENVFMGNLVTGWVTDHTGTYPEHLLSLPEVADQVVSGWLASPGHRRNMLEVYWRREGIGIAVDDEGKVLVTQTFC